MSTALPDNVNIYVNTQLHLAAMTILYFDYIVTLPTEIKHIWSSPTSMGSLGFFLNRYLCLIGNIILNVYSFQSLTEHGCSMYSLLHQALLVANQVVVCTLLLARIYALFNRSRWILYGILGFGSALVAVSIWALATQEHSSVMILEGCQSFMPQSAGYHVAVPWISLVFFDISIFSLTMFKTLSTVGRGALTTGQGGRMRWLMLRDMADGSSINLVRIVGRDGAVYFMAMALMTIANVTTFYKAEPVNKGCLSTFASVISVTLMSRLMLNLHATPDRGGVSNGSHHMPLTHASPLSTGGDTGGVLTSRISGMDFDEITTRAPLDAPDADAYNGARPLVQWQDARMKEWRDPELGLWDMDCADEKTAK